MKLMYDYDLSAHNTFRMKVRCACYIEYENVEELAGLDSTRCPARSGI